MTTFSEEELADVKNAFIARHRQAASTASVQIPELEADGLIDLSNVYFTNPFGMDGFYFPVGCDFSSSIFTRSSHFKGVTFCDNSLFHGTRFLDLAIFDDAIFSGASFDGALFSDIANFDSAIFTSPASFDGAIFSGSASFSRATFSYDVDFNGVTFSDYAGFWRATFSDAANFTGTTFSNSANFSHATFHSTPLFVNTEMKGRTTFEVATFCSPPRFFGAKLHEGTVWRRVKWPTPSMRTVETGEFVDAYERLKLEMDRLKKHDDELDFFALELQSRRVLHGDWKPISELKLFGRTIPVPALPIPITSFASRSGNRFGPQIALPLVTLRKVRLGRPSFGLAIGFYGVLCDYGRSFVRPLSGLLITAATGALPFWFYFGWPSKFWPAIGLSLANTFGVLGFRKEFIKPHVIDALPGILKVFAALQTGAGIVLLFLFGLALRNRFRMK